MLLEDGGGQASFSLDRISVDVRGLDDFAQLLRSELEANFAPTAHRVVGDHSAGVAFGQANQSLDMKLLRERYADCLARARLNLKEYVDASEILIAAAGMIAEEYRNVDQLSAAQASAVEGLLAAAVNEFNTAREEAIAAAQRIATQQRLARLEEQGVL